LIPLAGGLLLASFAVLGAAVASAAQLGPSTQLLPQSLPAIAPPSAPAPLPPPINPGYAAAPPSGLSPLLTQPGPVYELPAPANPSYPPQQLPGPIDQQKLQSYRNDLRGQQWQLERQGVGPGSNQSSREIQQQLNQPDPQ
jgi:hypothetical protein